MSNMYTDDHGKLHREDGPAIEGLSGKSYYYLYGVEIPEELFKRVIGSPVEDLPLYLGLGFDKYITKRLKRDEYE